MGIRCTFDSMTNHSKMKIMYFKKNIILKACHTATKLTFTGLNNVVNTFRVIGLGSVHKVITLWVIEYESYNSMGYRIREL